MSKTSALFLKRLRPLLLSAILLLVLSSRSSTFAQAAPPTTFIDLEYSYDGIGNATGIEDHISSSNDRFMQYDSLDRLTGANGSWGSGSFSYDEIGNRTLKNIGGTARAVYISFLTELVS